MDDTLRKEEPGGTVKERGPLTRLAVFVVALVSLLLLVPFVRVAIDTLFPRLGQSGPRMEVVLNTWALLLATWGAHTLVLRIFHRGEWSYVGMHRAAWTPRKIVAGVVVGFLAIAIPSAALILLQQLSIASAADGSWLRVALGALLLLVPAALWEELVMRGYFFSAVWERFGSVAALTVTSAIFGALHLGNDGVTVLSTAAVTLAGVLLGLVRLAMASLYAAWAAHLAWNFVLVGVLHTPVSGYDMGAADYRVVDSGPDWLTGGTWGPEGGLPAMIGMVLGILFLQRRLHSTRGNA